MTLQFPTSDISVLPQMEGLMPFHSTSFWRGAQQMWFEGVSHRHSNSDPSDLQMWVWVGTSSNPIQQFQQICFFSLLTIPQSFSSASSSLSVGFTKNSNSLKSKRLPCSKNTSEDCGNHHASCKIMSVNRLEFSDRATPPVQPWHLLVKSSSRCGHFGSRALVYRHPRRCRRCSGCGRCRCGRCRCGRRGCRGGGSTTFMGHGGHSRRWSSRTP